MGELNLQQQYSERTENKYIYIKQIIRLKNWIESLVVLPG